MCEDMVAAEMYALTSKTNGARMVLLVSFFMVRSLGTTHSGMREGVQRVLPEFVGSASVGRTKDAGVGLPVALATMVPSKSKGQISSV